MLIKHLCYNSFVVLLLLLLNLPKHPCRQQRPHFFLLRSIPGFSSVLVSSDELYDNALENLQWLVPMDIRQLNIFSPQSSYQINLRYRNSSSVKRYPGYQLWKIHENNIENAVLRAFWRLFG